MIDFQDLSGLTYQISHVPERASIGDQLHNSHRGKFATAKKSTEYIAIRTHEDLFR